MTGRWTTPRSALLWGDRALSKPEVVQLHATIEAWLAEVPDSAHRREFERRLKDRSNENHLSALQELGLHHEFVRRGYSVQREPEMVGSSSRPDFRVTTPFGPAVVEAVVARRSDERATLDGRLWALIDDLERTPSGLHIIADVRTPLPRGLKTSLVRKFLGEQLVAGWGSDGDPDRTYRTDDGSVEVVFSAFPVAEDPADEDQGGAVGIGGFGYGFARAVEAPDRIRSALASKARRYGKLSEPYAICIFPTTEFRSLDTERQAIDRFFFERRGGELAHARVSAVAVFDEVRLGDRSIGHRFRVYHNPFAVHLLPVEVFNGWPQLVGYRTGSGATFEWRDPPGEPAVC
ncbi:MAG: hypothetical protein HY690_18485 [Chloroflexi bacterium]|nr:hypothetical protein [Chloroflexota bacterium]